jgi:geranylgeranylglycerol-phosphate geranylgeranyltransferase
MIRPLAAPAPDAPPVAWRRALAWLRLVRLSNSVPASLLVIVGAYSVHGLPLPASTWRAAAAMWFITAYGYVFNDLADIAEDRINRPNRPLPSGDVTQRQAQLLAAALLVVSLVLALSISPLALGVALLVALLLTLYPRRLKGAGGVGNGIVGLLAGLALVTGGVSAVGPDPMLLSPLVLPALVLSSFISAREVLKTLEDAAGDRATGKATLTVRYGADGAAQVFRVLAVLTTFLGLLPVTQLAYSQRYLVLFAFGVAGPLLLAAIRLGSAPSPHTASRWLAITKASYFIGLAAILAA